MKIRMIDNQCWPALDSCQVHDGTFTIKEFRALRAGDVVDVSEPMAAYLIGIGKCKKVAESSAPAEGAGD